MKPAYPATRTVEQIDNYHGTVVPDPYRWLEDVDSEETLDWIRQQIELTFSFSPYHNLKPDTVYPATFVTTADHDDRVVPGHSFKFAARLQACQHGEAPVLIRIQTKAGHGFGKPTAIQIEECSDIYAFLWNELWMQ